MFWFLIFILITIQLTFLYKLRNRPIYDPSVLFTLSSLLWLVIIYGYITAYQGYLAYLPSLYKNDYVYLSVYTVILFIISYLSFIIGSHCNERTYIFGKLSFQSNLLLFSKLLMIIGLANFTVNVYFISFGNVWHYLATTALRSYQIADGVGVTAFFYIFGVIGFQLYLYDSVIRRRKYVTCFFLCVTFLLIIFSQGRMFQTIVFLGSSYFVLKLAIAKREKKHTSFVKSLIVMGCLISFGVLLYFLRILSAINSQNIEFDFGFINQLILGFNHFAFERGNVPNIPVIFTIIENTNGINELLLGKSIFNILLTIVPVQFLHPEDYLISLWIKNKWYTTIEGGGLPATSVGEWYANFGLIGVSIGMFLMGFIFRYIYQLCLNAGGSFSVVIWSSISMGYLSLHSKVDFVQIPSYSILVCLLLFIAYSLFNNVFKLIK